MAIYHLSVRVVSRAKGGSSVGSAAYIAREKLQDERTGLTHDGTRNGHELAHSEIMLPENAPEAWRDRETLWNEVEAAEIRKDAACARSIVIALPKELTTEQNIELARDYCQQTFVDRGQCVDLAIHEKVDATGEPQPHMHILLSTRKISEDGFGLKVEAWRGRDAIREYRESWANVANEHLARHDHDVRIDHRSFADQGIELEPSQKIGPGAKGRGDRGEASERTERNREIAAENGRAIIERPEIALDAITRQQSTFTERDLARHVHRNSDGADQFAAVMSAVKSSPDLVRLGVDGRGQERFSSRDMVAVEQRIARDSDTLAERKGHGVRGMYATGPGDLKLRNDQAAAVLHVTRGSGDLALVSGLAGTGKSTAMRAAREVWEDAGYNVRGAALSGIAAQGLQEGSGIESRTLASLEHAWKDGRDQLTSRDVIVVDEAGMVGSRQLGMVLDHAKEAGAKVVLVGDAEQLQAINAGAAFRALAERHGYAEITGVVRQHDEWQREATTELATGRTAAAIGRYEDTGFVRGSRTQDEARHDAVDTWNAVRQMQPGASQIMLAYERKDVAELNGMARDRMRSTGNLGSDVTIATESGEQAFATGDRLMFRQNSRDLGVKNGTLGTVKDIAVDGSMRVKLDGKDGATVAFNATDYGHVEHGYATTIHKSQGVTVDRAHVLASKYMDRHSTYVALSRHRDGVTMHYSHETFAAQSVMRHQLGREALKDTTLDYADQFARRHGVDVHRPAPERAQGRGADRYTGLRDIPVTQGPPDTEPNTSTNSSRSRPGSDARAIGQWAGRDTRIFRCRSHQAGSH